MKKILVILIVVLCIGFGVTFLLKNKRIIDADSAYSYCELGDLVGDDVERIVYKDFNIDYHTEDFAKAQIEELAQECINENVKKQYQMDCCMSIKMYPED